MFSGEIGSIVRSCPDDWKQGDGAALACMTHRSKHNQNNDVCRSSFSGFVTRLAGEAASQPVHRSAHLNFP